MAENVGNCAETSSSKRSWEKSHPLECPESSLHERSNHCTPTPSAKKPRTMLEPGFEEPKWASDSSANGCDSSTGQPPPVAEAAGEEGSLDGKLLRGPDNHRPHLSAAHIQTSEKLSGNHKEPKSIADSGVNGEEIPGSSGTPVPGSGDDDDNISEISGLSDIEGSGWRPVAGPLAWVHRQMSNGVDPRNLLRQLIPDDYFIPEDVDNFMLWKIILNIMSEPPRRKKLSSVNTLDDVVSLLKSCSRIVVLTGAGVSVSCGIPDFRSRDGIYARLSVEYPDLPDPQAMFDIQYFKKNPRPFFKFAKEIYPGQFEPSLSHKFIQLLQRHNKLLRNYTQNIDTLEQVAGISEVIQCHGSFAKATCMVCKLQVDAETVREDIMAQRIPRCTRCPAEEEMAIMKPDIVFFGESLSNEFHEQMEKDKDDCDMLIVIGSSLKVRPVALIPNSLPAGTPQILINRESLKHLTFDVELLGDCDNIVGELCHRLGNEWESVCSSDQPSVEMTRDELPTPPLYHSDVSSMSPGSNNSNPASCSRDSSDDNPRLSFSLEDIEQCPKAVKYAREQDSGVSSSCADFIASTSKCRINGSESPHSTACDRVEASSPPPVQRVTEQRKHSPGGSTDTQVHSPVSEGHRQSHSPRGVRSPAAPSDATCRNQDKVHLSSDAELVHCDSPGGVPSLPAPSDSTSLNQNKVPLSPNADLVHCDSPGGVVKEQADQDHSPEGVCNGAVSSTQPEMSVSGSEPEEGVRKWWPRYINLGKQLKENHHLFLPPNRYVFKGAEVYDGGSSDSSHCSDLSDSSSCGPNSPAQEPDSPHPQADRPVSNSDMPVDHCDAPVDQHDTAKDQHDTAKDQHDTAIDHPKTPVQPADTPVQSSDMPVHQKSIPVQTVQLSDTHVSDPHQQPLCSAVEPDLCTPEGSVPTAHCQTERVACSQPQTPTSEKDMTRVEAPVPH